jgi:hypothetical protein
VATTIKYDNSDIEGGGGGTEPTPGLYPGKIVSVTHRTKKADNSATNDLEVVLDIGEEYVRLWSYIQLPGSESYERSRWKLRELTDALGLPPKGTLDPKKMEGQEVMVKTKMRRDDPERAEVKNLFKPGEESVKPGEDPTSEDTTDYSEWSLEDLEAEIQERELDMPAGRKTVAKLAAVLEESDGDDTTGDAEGDGGDDDAEFNITEVEGFEDFDEWSKEDLQTYMAENAIIVAGRYSEAKAREAITDYVKNPPEGEEASDEAEAAHEDDYDEWTDDELKQEITDRNEQGAEIKVAGRWTRDKAIACMRADDAENPF